MAHFWIDHDMKTKDLEVLAIQALEDLKAIDLVAHDVRKITPIADTMIICSGRSSKHVQAMAQELAMQAKAHKVSPVRIEGEREGDWVIVDMGDVVAHIMLPATRALYQLEELWAPVSAGRNKQNKE